MMDVLNAIGLAASLPGTECALNHGKHDTDVHPAVDYLTIPMGDTATNTHTHDLTIPICQECVDGLHDPEWTLRYCITCGNSAWTLKALSPVPYTDQLDIFKGCPKCKGKSEDD